MPRRSKFSRSSLTLVRRIMKMLEAGYYPARIARILGKHRSHIHYYLKRLENMGYIEKEESLERLKPGLYVKRVRGIITLYRITQAGSNFLAGIERRAVGRRLRLHNAYFKYRIVRQPTGKIAWRKVELTNWTQLIGLELGLKVRKNPGSIEVIAPVVEGRDPYELLFRARDEADCLATHLEQKFGMVLGRGKLSRKAHWGVYDPVAGVYSKFFQLSDDVAKIDESEGFSEIDWLSPEAAKDYLIMPMRVQRLEQDVKDIKEGQRLFSEGMLEHMKMIQEVRELARETRELVKALRRERQKSE